MYHKPPFLEGEQRLAIINGNYRIPHQPAYSDFCVRLLKAMLTVDPDRRASADQIFKATQNLTDICLPKVVNDKDGFNFPQQMKHQEDFEDFNPPINQKPAAGAQNGQNSGPKKEDDTSLVDDLLKDAGGQSDGKSQSQESTTASATGTIPK